MSECLDVGPSKVSVPPKLFFVNRQCGRLPTVWAWGGQPDVSNFHDSGKKGLNQWDTKMLNLSKKVGVSRHDVNSGLIYHILIVSVYRWSPQFCSQLILLWKLATLLLTCGVFFTGWCTNRARKWLWLHRVGWRCWWGVWNLSLGVPSTVWLSLFGYESL